MSITRPSFYGCMITRSRSSESIWRNKKKKKKGEYCGIKRFAMSEMRKVLSIRCWFKTVVEHWSRSLYARNIRADGNRSSGKQSEDLNRELLAIPPRYLFLPFIQLCYALIKSCPGRRLSYSLDLPGQT